MNVIKTAVDAWNKRYTEGKGVCTQANVDGDPIDYTQHPFLHAHAIALPLTGSLTADAAGFVSDRFLKPPPDLILSIGPGMAWSEQALAKGGYAEKIIAYEMSNVAVKKGREHIRAAGLDFILDLRCGDVLKAGIAPNSFDVVYVQAALHHFFNIEEMFEFMHRVLKPGGLLMFDEYIGPDMHQYDDLVMQICNLLNAALDERLRCNALHDGQIREVVPKATLTCVSRLGSSFESIKTSQCQ